VKGWRVFLKTGDSAANLVKAGDEWDMKLRKTLREMTEMIEF
jgi:hypothetical protein